MIFMEVPVVVFIVNVDLCETGKIFFSINPISPYKTNNVTINHGKFANFYLLLYGYINIV